MLRAFGDISKHVKLKNKVAVIDNFAFRLHYRASFLLLLTATVLVSSRQYIGEHIRCINDKSVSTHVIDTFCFFTSTFTVVRHLNKSTGTDADEFPHPGVGPLRRGGEPVIRHAYYQWVPFVLFAQALMFYAPHFLWKRLEGGRVLALVTGFENCALALRDAALQIDKQTLPSRAQHAARVAAVRKAFLDRLHINNYWATSLVICELCNLANAFIQVFLTDLFLRGAFLGLGVRLMFGGDELDPLEVTFPKLTKCTFYKYGASGSLQTHDAMCVMALNIINEKIYTVFWFWMVFLLTASLVGLVWRILTFLLHARSQRFNKWVFRGNLDRNCLHTITSRCSFSDWLYLYYLGKSMECSVFRELIRGMAEEMDEIKPGSTEKGNGDVEKLFVKEE